MRLKKISNQKGLSLIETIVAIAILAIIATALLSVFTGGITSLYTTGERETAKNNASSIMEMLYEKEPFQKKDDIESEVVNYLDNNLNGAECDVEKLKEIKANDDNGYLADGFVVTIKCIYGDDNEVELSSFFREKGEEE